MKDDLVKGSQGLVKDLVNDCISRQAAIETVRKAKSIGQAHRMLVQLPSAQPTGTNTVQVEDCISREAALTALERDEEYDKDIPNRADGVRDAIITISALPSAQPGWIPCSTALPSKYDNYLITTEDGMVVFGVYDPREKQWCRYDSIKSWWLYGIKVLAWMPLPKPYREGGQS